MINGTPKAAYEQYTRVFTLDLEPGTYYISGGEYSAGCAVAQIKITNADGTKIYRNNREFDVLGTEKEISIIIQSTSTDPIDNYKVYPMLNKGSIALPFEPYTGGKPSPSPDYPQEIQSAGDDGNLNAMVRGKNIFPGPEQPKTVEKNGLTFSYKDGMYTLVGTSNTDTWFNIYPNIRNSTSTADTGGTIHSIGKVAVANGLKNESCTINIRDANIKDKTENITSSNNKKHLSFDTNGAFVHVRPGTYSETFTLMIVDENQAEDYEPYHTPQTLTLSTPNGLPGIQVSSGGNYTDENGQQWVCDEVDLGRGVYVQRIGILILDDKSSIRSVSKWDNAHLDVVQPYRVDGVAMIKRKVICDRLPSVEGREAWDLDIEMVGGVWFTDGTGFYLDFYIKNQRLGTTKDTSPDDATTAVLKWLKDNPLSCKYALATPIKTPLTASEIAAYKSLRTYKGTTIVEAEDKAGISATYKCNVKAAEKEVNALYDSLMAEMEELNENSEIV